MTPEFSRPHRLDQIGAGESQFSINADPNERAGLVRRFGLAALDRIAATGTLRRDAAGVVARGHLSAHVTQSCIATGDDVPATIEEDPARSRGHQRRGCRAEGSTGRPRRPAQGQELMHP
jgi:hypothetical protein